MLNPLITVRHDQAWSDASVILILLALVIVVSLADWWVNGGTGQLERDYDGESE